MALNRPISLYKSQYLDKQDDRLALFEVLARRFSIERALYPGSFVHLTPSFCFPEVVYVDLDHQARAFFASRSVREYVSRYRQYDSQPIMRFHGVDYREGVDEARQAFDLLISQSAGFVSLYCGEHLKPEGILLANNLHGDASMASLDDGYELIGVLSRRGTRFSFSDKDLDSYFVPKRPVMVTKDYLLERQRGIGYARSATSYLFRRVSGCPLSNRP